MDEKKNEVLEDGVEAVEETVEAMEEVVEESVEAMEEAVETDEVNEFEEETDALYDEMADELGEAEKYVQVERLISEVKSLRFRNRILSAIVAAVALLAVIWGGMNIYKEVYNPYNHMGYYNFSGMTLADFAEMHDVSVEKIIDDYDLPADIKDDTYYDVIQYLVPVSTMADMYGVDFATLKEAFQFSDDITADSTWGEAYDTIPLSVLFGDEAAVAEFVEEYSLDTTITGETRWGEVRQIVDKIEYEKMLAQQATDVMEDVTE